MGANHFLSDRKNLNKVKSIASVCTYQFLTNNGDSRKELHTHMMRSSDNGRVADSVLFSSCAFPSLSFISVEPLSKSSSFSLPSAGRISSIRAFPSASFSQVPSKSLSAVHTTCTDFKSTHQHASLQRLTKRSNKSCHLQRTKRSGARVSQQVSVFLMMVAMTTVAPSIHLRRT